MSNGRRFKRDWRNHIPIDLATEHLLEAGQQHRAEQRQLHDELYPAQRKTAAEARRRLPGHKLVWRSSTTPPGNPDQGVSPDAQAPDPDRGP